MQVLDFDYVLQTAANGWNAGGAAEVEVRGGPGDQQGGLGYGGEQGGGWCLGRHTRVQGRVGAPSHTETDRNVHTKL